MKKISTKLSVMKTMPPLHHKLPDKDYSQKQSEVLKWLSEQPLLLEYLIEQANNAKLIKYDSIIGTWQGVDYSEKCIHGYSDWDDCPDCRH